MEAFLYETNEDNRIVCHLCNHHCKIKTGKRGICGVRENDSGKLNSLVYGNVIARSVDPIEKKPLYHVAPGSLSYSIATVGCNFKCRFCQNADIAQMPSDNRGMIVGNPATPKDIVEDARKRGCKTIAYTYTEPTIYFEFAYDTAKAAMKEGIKNVFVTNGYMTPEAIEMIAPYLDAANVDLKAATDDFYKTYCSARIDPVKASLKHMKANDIFVEITTLVITDLNDSEEDFKHIARFIYDELGPDTPWHVSRFHPTYKLTDRGATPLQKLSLAREIGLKTGLRYVYTGNVPGDDGEHTFCYQCKKKIVDRYGYHIKNYHVKDGKCAYCGAVIDGIDM